MGFMDTVKQQLSRNKPKVKDGVDKAADVIGDKAGAHADKVQRGAEAVKDGIDKLPG